MRWSVFFTLILSLLFVAGTLAAPAQGLGREIEARQEKETDSDKAAESTTSETSATQTDASTTALGSTATSTSTSAPTTNTGTANTTNAVSTTASAAEATSTVPSLDGATAASQQEAADSARPTYSGGLPIKPVITPALGVGGFILLALGAVLAFIGVRKQWVQIFLSTAFLTALGVTVLIVYVMSPPVSNAVQGGYVVAVFFTGAVFGGLSMVFKEICEGLGCLLGGFCLSMWLLALKSGGLLTESGPRTGMIIAFSVGFYCLSFSHYTRPYGLIGCSSFSGATALVLGIDCFSRAGLKEFWLYIWGLNQNIFPLKTDTYPVTRNIRVELAVTIIVSVLGVISQLRLWKVIKERRAKEEDARKEHERKIEEEDAEAGRQLEEKNIQERAEWEMTYGNGQDSKSKTASVSETAIGEDSRRGSDGFTSSNNDKDGDIEMKEMQSPEIAAESEKNGEARELEPVQEEDAQESTEQEKQQGPEQENGDSKARPETPVVTHVLGEDNDNSSENGAVIGSEAGTPRSKRMSGRELLNRLSWRNSTDMKVTSQSREALVAHNDASSSVYGVVDDVDDLQEVSVGCPSIASDIHERVQEGPMQEAIVPEDLPEKRTIEMETQSNAGSQAVRENTVPGAGLAVDSGAAEHQDAQKDIADEPIASKVAPQASKEAGLGVVTDAAIQNVASKVFNYETFASRSTQPTSTTETVAPTPIESTIASPLDRTGISVMSEQLQSPDTPATDIQPEITDAPMSQKAETVVLVQVSQKDGLVEPLKETEAQPTVDTIDEEVIPLPGPKPVEKIKREQVIKKLNASTVKALPEQTSRIIHSYRTNEWAKHLADADTPEMEPIEFDTEPEVKDSEEVQETAAFVDVDGLLQTPLNAQPPPAVNRTEPYEVEAIQPAAISSVPSAEAPRSKFRSSLSRAMQSPLSRNASTGSVNMLRASTGQLPHSQEGQAGLRSASTPYLTITAPENKETEQTPKWNGPPPLLAVREDMVRNRMSSTSLRYDPWASRNQSRQSFNDIPPISPPLSVPEERDEDYEQGPLRDEDDIPLSKRRTMLQRQTMQSPYAASVHSLEAPSPVQSPPPGAELNRSASRMAAWRQSVREEITHKRDPLALPPQSPPMGGAVSPDRPHSSLWGSVQQMRDASSRQLDSAVANGMQRGSMTDLHRQAMRRMQASANKKL